jgi:hypothetical protein
MREGRSPLPVEAFMETEAASKIEMMYIICFILYKSEQGAFVHSSHFLIGRIIRVMTVCWGRIGGELSLRLTEKWLGLPLLIYCVINNLKSAKILNYI